jgi:hypothetical protein
VVPFGAVKTRVREQLVCRRDMQGVKGMQVDDGLNLPTLIGVFVYVGQDTVWELAGIEQDVPARPQAHQRGLRAHIEQSGDAVGAADVPEIVVELDDGHVLGNL